MPAPTSNRTRSQPDGGPRPTKRRSVAPSNSDEADSVEEDGVDNVKTKKATGRGHVRPKDKAMTLAKEERLAKSQFGIKYLENFSGRLRDPPQVEKHGWVSKEELDRMLMPVSTYWIDEDQQKLEADWERDPLRTEINQLNNNNAGRVMRILWKICVQRMRCPPTDIISDENRLGINTTFHKKARHPDSPVWTEAFVTAFMNIMFYELWRNGDVKVLAMVLQFTVIVRTGDKKTWELENPTTDRFLDNLIDEIQVDAKELDIKKRRSIALLCRAANKPLAGRAPSLYYVLFKSIIKYQTLEKYDESLWVESFDDKPYLLLKTDLDVIAKALEEDVSPYEGIPSIASQALRFAHITKDDSRCVAPSSMAEVQRVLCKAVLAQRIRRETRLRAAGMSMVPGQPAAQAGNEAAPETTREAARETSGVEEVAEEGAAATDDGYFGVPREGSIASAYGQADGSVGSAPEIVPLTEDSLRKLTLAKASGSRDLQSSVIGDTIWGSLSSQPGSLLSQGQDSTGTGEPVSLEEDGDVYIPEASSYTGSDEYREDLAVHIDVGSPESSTESETEMEVDYAAYPTRSDGVASLWETDISEEEDDGVLVTW